MRKDFENWGASTLRLHHDAWSKKNTKDAKAPRSNSIAKRQTVLYASDRATLFL
jgi:hypothetical protein